MSFFLQQVIVDAGAMEEGALPPMAHSVRTVATSADFLRNWLVSKVLGGYLETEPCVHVFLFPRYFVFS